MGYTHASHKYIHIFIMFSLYRRLLLSLYSKYRRRVLFHLTIEGCERVLSQNFVGIEFKNQYILVEVALV